MNPVKVFLVCAFITALTLVTAMWATAITELNNHPKEEDQ